MASWDCFCGAKEGKPCKCPPACNATDKMRQERDAALLQISEERERCAKIVEGKISTSGPIGIASFELLPIIAKEIRAGVPLKQNPETKGE